MPANNVVTVRIFPAQSSNGGRSGKAVVVLPQWNSDAEGHVGLCQAARAVRRHRASAEPALSRSAPSGGARTRRIHRQLQRRPHAARQPAGRARRQAGDRLAGLRRATTGSACSARASDRACRCSRWRTTPRVRAGAFNHISPYFADVVWRGLSTRHVRAGLDGHLTLDELREYWMPISPWPFIDRIRGRQHPARVRALRPDVSGRFVAADSSASSSASGIRARPSRSCRAVTTRPARRRSSTSTATI